MTGIAAAVAVVLAAGCSNVATYEVQLPTEAAALTLDQLEANYTEEEPLEIDFWTGFGGAVTSTGILPAIEAFETEYPFIKVNHTSKGGYDNLLKAINLSITSNSYPQVAVGYPDHFASYIRSSIQYALNPFIESTDPDIGVDIDDYVADYMVENRSFQFKDEEKTDPYTLGLPFNKSTEVMVVNQTFMDWIATKDDRIVIPTTWDEVRTVGLYILATMGRIGAYGHKIDENGDVNDNAGKLGHPKLLLDFSAVTSDEFRPFSYDSTSNLFITMVRQWGGQYTKWAKTSPKDTSNTTPNRPWTCSTSSGNSTMTKSLPSRLPSAKPATTRSRLSPLSR
jgi:ABC-type glycerol-3-phosphate transport system substrate-binding protein